MSSNTYKSSPNPNNNNFIQLQKQLSITPVNHIEIVYYLMFRINFDIYEYGI